MARIPGRWFNISSAFPELSDPYVDAGTGKVVTAADLETIFPAPLVEQELDDRNDYLTIPDEVLDRYARWRPTPLLRARAFEAAIGTRCRIFYKYEGSSPIGSHKANSGVAQAYFAKLDGRQRVFAETGAGQWGSAISMGASFSGLECNIFMVAGSFDAKPGRRILMETFGSTVHRSPTDLTAAGRAEQARHPDSSGHLGLAIAEAVEAAKADPAAAYSLGSAFGFVCLHQTVIGQEVRQQLAECDLSPDVVVSCIGGGSSFAGMTFPFLEDIRRGARIDLLAVESDAVPKVTKGVFDYDFGDSEGLTPLIKMFTLGHTFAAPAIHSGGLRYHGLAPQVSKMIDVGLARGVAVSQLRTFQAGVLFAQCEGLVPAPESAHSIAAAWDYAVEHRDKERTIVLCLTGHGFFDLSAYQVYLAQAMEDSTSPSSEIAASLAALRSDVAARSTRARGASSRSGGLVDPMPAAAAGPNQFTRWQHLHFGSDAGNGSDAGKAPAGAATYSGPGPEFVDLTAHQVITEAVLRGTAGDGDIRVDVRAVVTPAADSFAKATNRRIVRAGSKPDPS